MSDERDYISEDLVVDGVSYRVAIKRKANGFSVYWSCFTCRQGETWSSTSINASEAMQIALDKLHSHHTSDHSLDRH
jgi:hypothetical protein